MPNFECDACGKSHRQFARWDKCQTKKSRTKCICPDYWRKRWTSHSPDCPLRGKEAA